MGRLDEYREKLGRFLDVPRNAFGQTVTVEIRGFSEVMVQGCKGILDYSPSVVILDSPQGKIIISGNELSINVFSDDRLVILGIVENVRKGDQNGETSF